MPYADKEKQRAYHREYQQRPKRKAYKKQWDVDNRERLAEYQKRLRQADPKKYRTYFRNHYLVKTYGITQDQYEAMYKQQGGVCAICGGLPDIVKHGITRLAVDHDHATGKVRGLLCNNCNSGMGIIGDTIEHLERALAYLKQHEERT